MTDVVLLGSTMVDIYGKSFKKLLPSESNPGTIELYIGGVSRNIAENLNYLNVDLELISCIGDDHYGRFLKSKCEEIGLNISHSYFPKNMTQSIYMAIIDDDGEMTLALSDTETLKKLPIDYIKQKDDLIEQAKVIVVDTCFSKELLEYISNRYKHKKILIDPVSIGLSYRIKNIIGNFHTLKCNKNEAEYLSDMEITDDNSLKEVGKKLINKGLNQCFITLGSKGVYYINKNKQGILESIPVNVANATGAGDAFSAGVTYCLLNDKDIEYTAKFSSCMSNFALRSTHAVSDKIKLDSIIKMMEEQKWTIKNI